MEMENTLEETTTPLPAGGIQMKSTYKVFKFNFPLPENWKHLMSLLKQGGRAFYFTYIYRQYTIPYIYI